MDGVPIPTRGFDEEVIWTPVIRDGRAGFRCTRLRDLAVTYVYLNPSTSGEGAPDVFLYEGPHFDPAEDLSVCFVTPVFEERK